jgi:hypothetical protein
MSKNQVRVYSIVADHAVFASCDVSPRWMKQLLKTVGLTSLMLVPIMVCGRHWGSDMNRQIEKTMPSQCRLVETQTGTRGDRGLP